MHGLKKLYLPRTLCCQSRRYFAATGDTYDISTARSYAQLFENTDSLTFACLFRAMTDFSLSQILLNYDEPLNQKHNVIDVACGCGAYCRKVKETHPHINRIVGIDISKAQIQICNEYEQENPLNIEYEVLDASHLIHKHEYHNQFDIANCNWLYDYASTEQELELMIKSIYECLKANNNSIHTGMYWNTEMIASYPEEWIKYGFQIAPNKEPGSKLMDGEQLLFRFSSDTTGEKRRVYDNISGNEEIDEGTIVSAYFWSGETVQRLFEKAGFVDFEFIQPQNWIRKYLALNQNQYKFFMEYSTMGNHEMCGFVARKP
eukprot:235727_1